MGQLEALITYEKYNFILKQGFIGLDRNCNLLTAKHFSGNAICGKAATYKKYSTTKISPAFKTLLHKSMYYQLQLSVPTVQ